MQVSDDELEHMQNVTTLPGAAPILGMVKNMCGTAHAMGAITAKQVADARTRAADIARSVQDDADAYRRSLESQSAY